MTCLRNCGVIFCELSNAVYVMWCDDCKMPCYLVTCLFSYLVLLQSKCLNVWLCISPALCTMNKMFKTKKMNPIFVIYILRLFRPSVIEEWQHAFYKWYMTHCWSLFYVCHYVANFFHVASYMLPKICITWYIECTCIVWILKVFIALKTHHNTIKN